MAGYGPAVTELLQYRAITFFMKSFLVLWRIIVLVCTGILIQDMMNALQILLYSIFILLLLTGVLQFLVFPRNRTNKLLGMVILMVALGIFQAMYLMCPSSERINVVLLLPLNIVFAPYFLALCYLETLSQKKLFSGLYVRSVKYIAVLEVALHLLPLGAFLFMGEYSRPILDFLFSIRKIVYLAFLAFSLGGLYQGMAGLHEIQVQEGTDRKIYAGIRLFAWMIVLVAVLACVSVFVPVAGKRIPRVVFYIPQIVLGLFCVVWGIYHVLLCQAMTRETVEESRETRQTVNPIYRKLLVLMENEKIYRNPDLRISDVAEILAISPNYLSRIVNEISDEGFNELLNRYRVDDVIERIRTGEYQNQTLFGLAQQAGFSSKSTFQSVFKKMTGKTPSEYKQESRIL